MSSNSVCLRRVMAPWGSEPKEASVAESSSISVWGLKWLDKEESVELDEDEEEDGGVNFSGCIYCRELFIYVGSRHRPRRLST